MKAMPPRRMYTMLDWDPTEHDSHERNFVAKVREHGWFQMAIQAEGEHPSFSYTTGFMLNVDFPELIVFSMSDKRANDTFLTIYQGLKNGEPFPIREPIDSVFVNSKAMLLPVAESQLKSYFTWTRWFYEPKVSLRCLQLIWPDDRGLFPWQAGCEEGLAEAQPDLTDGHWAGLGLGNFTSAVVK
jgi:hypothetical protein